MRLGSLAVVRKRAGRGESGPVAAKAPRRMRGPGRALSSNVRASCGRPVPRSSVAIVIVLVLVCEPVHKKFFPFNEWSDHEFTTPSKMNNVISDNRAVSESPDFRTSQVGLAFLADWKNVYLLYILHTLNKSLYQATSEKRPKAAHREAQFLSKLNFLNPHTNIYYM